MSPGLPEMERNWHPMIGYTADSDASTHTKLKFLVLTESTASGLFVPLLLFTAAGHKVHSSVLFVCIIVCIHCAVCLAYESCYCLPRQVTKFTVQCYLFA